jgi:hypothetical protein
MNERIGGQLMQLDPVDKEEASKKFLNRKGEATNEEVNKDYPESDGGWGELSSPGILIASDEQAHLLQHLLVLCRKF